MTTYKSQERLEKINFDSPTYSNVFLASEKAKLATIRWIYGEDNGAVKVETGSETFFWHAEKNNKKFISQKMVGRRRSGKESNEF